MRRLFTILLASSLMQAGTGCSGAVQNSRDNQTNETTQSVTYEPDETETTSSEEQKESENMKNITVTVGDQSFSAVLYDNETADKFYDMLPLDLEMNELNGNEKYCYLDESLPQDTFKPNTINSGDIMLFGSDCIVLFYDTFSTGYSYTSLGKIENPDGLYEAVGNGSVSVTFTKG